MTSRFKQALGNYVDLQVVQQNWAGFIQEMVAAHDYDILWASHQGRPAAPDGGGRQGAISAKDLKPILFDNNQKTKLNFKEWSKDLNAWLKKIDCAYKEMLTIASTAEGEWNEVAYKQKVCDDVFTQAPTDKKYRSSFRITKLIYNNRNPKAIS